MKCPGCGWEMIGKCGNPDCAKGDKKKRPAFAAPLRARRGARGGRVRNYQASGDATIKDRDEQCTDPGYDIALGRDIGPRDALMGLFREVVKRSIGPRPED